MGTWNNTDGLHLDFGVTKAVNEVAGEYATYGELREIEINLDLTTLTSSPVIISETLKFPTGVFIQEIVTVAKVGATGSGATLDLGLIREDRTTEIDYNGLLAAQVLTTLDGTGEQTTSTPGSTYAGALLGTATTQVGYLTANYNTHTFDTGSARIRVRYYAATPITQ